MVGMDTPLVAQALKEKYRGKSDDNIAENVESDLT
jgi:6-phosphogluconate dehydrogenase (decarboxylating)